MLVLTKIFFNYVPNNIQLYTHNTTCFTIITIYNYAVSSVDLAKL